ncbi:sugar-binding protein [Bacillus alkalicellulosilyticus]|uniref:sugar-binding protein n=1 Tax=Alkalihalobacterium alkalicellulosilyticum TaxID=1912214 RepID=UPI00099868B5|nr:sugar-binding protein [Bacillus alkalicellulosilyticus]
MKTNYFISTIFLMIILLSLLLTYHFFQQTLYFDEPVISSQHHDETKLHFVLIVQELDSHYLQTLYKGAEAASEKHNATIEYWGTKQTNIEDHIKLLEMAIASKVDGILTQGLSHEFEAVIDKATEKGIPVILVDSDYEDNHHIPYVGTNNYQAGYDIGLLVLEEATGPTKVGIITGSLLANNLNERIQGFQDAIAMDSRVEVVSTKSSNLNKIQGTEQTFQMLKQHPDLSVIFGTSAVDSIGISDGIEKANHSSSILVYAFDDLDETISLIRKGKIHATLKQEPYDMGYTGVQLLISLLKKKDINKNFYTTTTILKKEDVDHASQN